MVIHIEGAPRQRDGKLVDIERVAAHQEPPVALADLMEPDGAAAARQGFGYGEFDRVRAPHPEHD